MTDILYDILKRYLQIIPLVTLISGFLAYSLGWVADFGHPPSLLKSFGPAFVFTSVFTIVLVPLFQLLDHYFPLRNVYEVILHVAVQTGVSIGCYFIGLGLNNLLFNIAAGTNEPYRLLNFLFTMMITFAVVATFYLQLFIRRSKEAEKTALAAELSALRAQINPHFLFNSLNSIASLVRTHPEQAERVTEDLAELFRYSLQSSKVPEVTVAQEIESARTYFSIEKSRFGDRLRLEVHTDPEVRDYKVPALLLQPLVENAVKHGFRHAEGEFTISLHAKAEGGQLRLEVTDSGPGFGVLKSDEIFGKGTGLSNIRDRIALHYGTRGDLRIEPNGVFITIPAS